MKSTVEAYKTWHTRAGIKGTGKRSWRRERRQERAEGRTVSKRRRREATTSPVSYMTEHRNTHMPF